MSQAYNVYCDESCHLQNDMQKAMVLGAIWSPIEDARSISLQIRDIKRAHGFGDAFEIKWTKVSPKRLGFYLELISYFFKNKNLHFRGLIVPDKSILRHGDYGQSHDDWYYKMYFALLSPMLENSGGDDLRIYIDIKDTHGAAKASHLHDVLCNSKRDFLKERITRVQIVRSEEVAQLQLADLLIGAVSYANRELSTSEAKSTVVSKIRAASGHDLQSTTPFREPKFNLLCWNPKA